MTVTKWSVARQHYAGEMTWAKTKWLSCQVERERGRNAAVLSNVFSLMERQQAGRQTGDPERYRPACTCGWHDTNNRSGHNCLWKDNSEFLIFVPIYFDIGSRSVKPSRMMEGRRLWRSASKEKREGVSLWMNTSDSSFFLCVTASVSLSFYYSNYYYCFIRLLFVSREYFLWSPYTLSSHWIDQVSVYSTHQPHILQTTEREQGRWSALWFSASRWWMWKIPVRGPSAVSLKPGDLYTGKGIRKAVEGKTYYTLCALMCMHCLMFI